MSEKKKTETPALPAELERVSRDELHLATFPIALLTYQSSKDTSISVIRKRKHPVTNKTVDVQWRVEGGSEVGLPTAGDEGVVMVLMEITREQGWPQDVFFSRAEMLERLGWSDSKKSYERLDGALNRLAAITIFSKNAFWDKTSKSFISTAIHLLDKVNLVEKRGRKSRGQSGTSKQLALELALSHVRWGDEVWRSFKDGQLKPISLSAYFALRLPLSRRLYRFLDLKKYDGKPVFEIGLRKLCEEYLALSHARYPSAYRSTLKPAHDELIEHGFLKAADFRNMKTADGEKVVYVFRAPGEPMPEMKPALPMPAMSEDEACDSVLARLKVDDTEEYLRILTDATELLNEIERAIWERSGENGVAWPRVQEHMRIIVEQEYRGDVQELMEA